MQFKRIFVSLLVVVLMLSATVFSASAEDVLLSATANETVAATLEIAVGTTPAADDKGNLVAKPGDKIDVSVTINNNPGITMVQVLLTYDVNALVLDEKVAIETAIFDFDQIGGSMGGVIVNDGSILFTSDMLSSKNNIATSGAIAKLSFTVKEGYHGTSVINIDDSKAYAYDATAKENVKLAPVIKNVNVLVHDPVAIPAVAPTCANTGLTEGMKCAKADCGEILVAQEEIPATGEHTPKAIAGVEATCVATGLTEGSVCSVCDAVITEQTVIPATGNHTAVEVPGVDATCTAEGLTAGSKCSVCNATLSEGTKTEKAAHTEVVIPAVEPTYSEDGATEGKKCSVCDEILVAPQVVPAKTLTWLWIVIAVVVVVGAGAAVYFFVIRKKSK